jgi:ParB-like chromosome segregation protein Spo0J
MAKPNKLGRSEVWALDRLRPNPENSRTHSAEQIELIASAIKQFGFTQPIVAVDEDGLILAGHARYLAARSISMPEVPVVPARGWTEDQKRAYLIADNALGDRSDWDDALLASAVAGLEENGFDTKALGLSAADLKRLKSDDDDDLTVHEVETSTVRDEFWVSIRGPLQHQAEVLRRMREATAEMSGVNVTLGTIGKD